VFVFWVVFVVLYGGLGCVWSGFGALSMLSKVTFNVVKRDVFGMGSGFAGKRISEEEGKQRLSAFFYQGWKLCAC